MAETLPDIFDVIAATASDVRDGFGERRSYMDKQNPSGETQLAADIYADELLEERLLELDAVGSYASEERDEVATDDGPYHVVCDPLDGSSNLLPNNGMGTIFGVYDSKPPVDGDRMCAAGFVLYGPITTMVEAVGDSVTEYLVEEGSRTVLQSDVTISSDPTVYGFGGRVPDWTPSFQSYVEDVEEDRLKLRYGGAMVADVNQVLTHGGIFGYPMLADNPSGKLRLQFEGHPIAYVVEAAGGASSDGTRSLLERTPDSLHERAPLFVGNRELIDRLEDAV